MEYLVKEAMKDLNNVIKKMNDNIKLDQEEIKKLKNNVNEVNEDIEMKIKDFDFYKEDCQKIAIFANTFFNGDLDICNIQASNFETAVREYIPTRVWELLGNQLIHLKDQNIKQEKLNEVSQKAKDILIAYKNDLINHACLLEEKLYKNFSNKYNDSKDELLIQCLKKLQQSDDAESQTLARKIRKTML